MEQQESLTAAIVAYIQGRGADKLEKLDKELAKLAEASTSVALEKRQQLFEKRKGEQEKHEPRAWLEEASELAHKIDIATHAIKYIHGDAKGTSCNIRNYPLEEKKGYVASHQIKNPTYDVVCGAALSGIAKLLTGIFYNGKCLLDYVLANDPSPLVPIAEDAGQAERWLEGFKQVFIAGELSSHKLAKQVYWPVPEEEGGYHLLSPLFASSLAQEVFDYRRALRDQQFSKDEQDRAKGYGFMPHLAVQTFGGTKSHNISQLNSQRGGRHFLLDNRPPENWTSTEPPPLNTASVFHKIIPGKAYRKDKAVHRLQRYLESAVDKPSTFDIRECRRLGVDELVEILLLYGVCARQFEAGWSASEDCHLPMDEKLWLDPKRAQTDEGFREAMDRKDWPDKIAGKFARWLNSVLQSNKLNLGDAEFAQWKVLVAQELRLTERARKEHY